MCVSNRMSIKRFPVACKLSSSSIFPHLSPFKRAALGSNRQAGVDPHSMDEPRGRTRTTSGLPGDKALAAATLNPVNLEKERKMRKFWLILWSIVLVALLTGIIAGIQTDKANFPHAASPSSSPSPLLGVNMTQGTLIAQTNYSNSVAMLIVTASGDISSFRTQGAGRALRLALATRIAAGLGEDAQYIANHLHVAFIFFPATRLTVWIDSADAMNADFANRRLRITDSLELPRRLSDEVVPQDVDERMVVHMDLVNVTNGTEVQAASVIAAALSDHSSFSAYHTIWDAYTSGKSSHQQLSLLDIAYTGDAPTPTPMPTASTTVSSTATYSRTPTSTGSGSSEPSPSPSPTASHTASATSSASPSATPTTCQRR
jgi:hypothetical protein